MDVYSSYATDAKKEVEGVWRDAPEKGRLLLARVGNRKYSRLLAQLCERNQRVLDLNNDASDAVSDEIMVEVMAKTVLLGWEGIKFKGKDLPYSLENAKMLLGVKDFRLLVSKLGSELNAYLEVAAEVGNG